MKHVSPHKLAIVFFAFFLFSLISFGQNSDTASLHSLRIIAGAQFSDQVNGGLFYRGSEFDNKSSYYNKVLSLPIASVSFGAKFKNVFMVFDFSYRSRAGYYDRGLATDHLKMKYVSYQLWYDFFNKKDFPINPLVSVNLSYANKIYSYLSPQDKPNGPSYDFKDISKTYMIDLPIGIYSHYKHFFISFTYTIPVFAWINGAFQEHLNTYSNGQLRSSDFTEDNYSGNSSDKDYERQRSALNLRIAYTFILKNK